MNTEYVLLEPVYSEIDYDDMDSITEDFIWNHLLEREIALNVSKAFNDTTI